MKKVEFNNTKLDVFVEDYNPEDSNLREQIKELQNRVEQLEIQNDTTQYNLNVLQQVIAIVSEFPAGKQIVNRAINRYQLIHLVSIILPRRKQALKEIESDNSMPKGIKDSFRRRELSMIKNTERAIYKRQKFETSAAQNVRTFFDNVSDFLNKHRKRLSPATMISRKYFNRRPRQCPN